MQKDKSYYNKKYYEGNKPYPVRLGRLKAEFQQKAVEEDISLHAYIKRILEKHFTEEAPVIKGELK